MKSARTCLGQDQNDFYCVGMHWFGIPQYPGKGYWGFSFWNPQKQFRWIDVTPDGAAQWKKEIERREWSFVSSPPMSLEEAVAIAQRSLGPQKELFLSGAGLDAKTYFRIQFFATGAKDYTNLYVTFDGKVFRNEHDVPGVGQ